MLLYYVRHGEPIYDPDSLTEYGHEQAEALVERFKRVGLDRIYSSTSNRAVQTAAPTARALGIEPTLLDFANEKYAWEQMGNEIYGTRRIRTWAMYDPEFLRRFNEPEVYALGDRWYDSPLFEGTRFKECMLRVNAGVDELMLSLGYRHDRARGGYEVVRENRERVALFAHQGFGLIFFSSLLDIPYPIVATRMDMTHSGMTVINFGEGPFCRPKMLQLSNDSHLFKAGILRAYNNEILV